MFFVIKKRTLIIGAVLFLVVCLLSVMVIGVIPTTASNKKLPIYYVSSNEGKVALTFDAAWGADKTLAIMDILDEHGYKGTFFLVGFWVDEHPDMLQTIHDRGYLVGNHSTNHLHMNKLNVTQIAEEIENTNKKIENIIGYSPTYFRAPFGEYNNRLIEYSEQNNIKVIQWDVDTLDWKGLSGSAIADRVLSRVKDGSIILCHNNADHILDALPLILIGLKNKGLTPVRLDELVINDNYYIDNNGMQIKK